MIGFNAAIGGSNIVTHPVLGPMLFPNLFHGHGPVDLGALKWLTLVFVVTVVGSLVIAWLMDKRQR